MPDAVPAGGARGGSRGTEGTPQGTSASAAGTSPEASPTHEQSGRKDDVAGTSAPRGDDAAAASTSSEQEQFEIPETRDHASPPDAPALPSPDAASPLAGLLGFWQQVDPRDRGADFAPGGFDLSLLAIRPTQRSMQVYRAWGPAPDALVIAAELRATFDASGSVRIEEAPTQPSRFPRAPIDLPDVAGAGPRTVVPPVRPLPWDGRWVLVEKDRLQLDGRLYQRIDRAEFERIGRASSTPRSGANARTPAAVATAGTAASNEPAGGVDFFGARVKGRYVCFVCDISGSMLGDKLERLKTEIVRTIRALPKGTHVQVTFFDDQAHVLVPDWTRTGTTACETLLRKIDGVGCGGGTDAVDALGFVFERLDPVPHEVFLLTDGQFGRDPAPALERLNGGPDRTRIHTLGMGDDADQAGLEAIARAHGGTYTHVPAQPPVLGVP